MSFDEALLRQFAAARSLPFDALFGAVWILTLFSAIWFVLALTALRDGRRGRWVAASVLLALAIEFVLVDLILKPGFARSRPFITFVDLPGFLVPAPSTFSFPSSDV